MKAVLTLAGKDLRLLIRDRTGAFFVLIFPVIYASFFGAIFSSASGDDGSAKIAVALADEDQTPESAAFVQLLQKATELSIRPLPRDTAVEEVRVGHLTAALVLPKGFGAARERMFYGDPPTIQLAVDPSRRAESGMLQGLLAKYMAQGMQDFFTNPEKMRKNSRDALNTLRNRADANQALAPLLERFFGELDQFMTALPKAGGAAKNGGGFRGFEPVHIEALAIERRREGPPNAYAVSFPQGIIWGVMGAAAGFGISLVSERTRGTMQRLCLAPLSRGQILAGKALACFLTTVAVSTALLAFAVLVFGVRPTSWPLLGLAIVSVSVGFVGIMMLLAVAGRTEQAAGGIGWAILTVMAMIGGGMVPLMFLPGWMQNLASVSPVKWSILAMEGAIWRGFDLERMLLPCGILIGIGVACFALGVRTFAWGGERQ